MLEVSVHAQIRHGEIILQVGLAGQKPDHGLGTEDLFH